MPRGDGTGPQGFGPMTGRAAGFCAGYSAPGFANFGAGRGFFGRGGGYRGFRNRYYERGLAGRQWFAGNRSAWGSFFTPGTATFAGSTDEQELELLKNQAKHFEDALQNIQKQIDYLSDKQNKG